MLLCVITFYVFWELAVDVLVSLQGLLIVACEEKHSQINPVILYLPILYTLLLHAANTLQASTVHYMLPIHYMVVITMLLILDI